MNGLVAAAGAERRTMLTLLAAAGPALILMLAAADRPSRPSALAALLLGWMVLDRRRHPAAVAWAATIPVALALAWARFSGPDTALGAACVDPLAPIGLNRLGEAAVVLLAVAALAIRAGVRPSAIGLRRPPRSAVVGGVALAGLVAVAGLVIGPALAGPFFGAVAFAMPLAAIVPALVFGVSNAVMEEVAYRGWLQHRLAPVVGTAAAIAVQGLVFGLAHVGPEVVALLPLHVAGLTSLGIIAGWLAARVGLWLPIAIHAGADVALYYGLACAPVG